MSDRARQVAGKLPHVGMFRRAQNGIGNAIEVHAICPRLDIAKQADLVVRCE